MRLSISVEMLLIMAAMVTMRSQDLIVYLNTALPLVSETESKVIRRPEKSVSLIELDFSIF